MASRRKIGTRSFLNKSSLPCRSFKKIAPHNPAAIPSKMNHGNCVILVNSNGGTVYHGAMPKKVRETVAATTDAQTTGANKFIEKLPNTMSDAKTAPEIGALYAAAMPDAAPQPTSRRNRYGGHFENWPHL